MTRTKPQITVPFPVLLVLFMAVSLTSNVAAADYLAADPGTQVSIQLNKGGALVVRPLGGTWSHPVCADLTAAVLSTSHLISTDYQRVYDLLLLAGTNGRLVNLRVSDTECHANGFPLIESLRVFP